MRLFVLARNYQEFKAWCWTKGIPELHATYVANAERVRGTGMLKPGQIVRLPGYRDNIHHAAIEDAVRMRTIDQPQVKL